MTFKKKIKTLNIHAVTAKQGRKQAGRFLVKKRRKSKNNFVGFKDLVTAYMHTAQYMYKVHNIHTYA